jgi:spore germination protein KA
MGETMESGINLGERLEANLSRLRGMLGDSSDIIIREFIVSTEKNIPAALIYLENLVDKNRIHNEIIRPLTDCGLQTFTGHLVRTQLKKLLATVDSHNAKETFKDTVDEVFFGNTVLLIDGLREALTFNTKGWTGRNISTLETEATVRGPRECFVENFGTNLGLLRRRISHAGLVAESFKVGEKTKTEIEIVYLKGVVNEKIVTELRRRISRIRTDAVLGAGYFEQFIGDAPFSPFATIAYSERPDVVTAKILEGRIAVIIDGSPEVLTVPALLVESFQSPDDYNSNPFYATLIRWIRYIAFGISLLAPGVYIALASYNQELIPTPLFFTMVAVNEGTPYPVVEVIVIGLIFEIFREASIRLPKSVGTAISFVAGLVVVQASVTAGLVAVSTVVVTAVTAIASLVVPNQTNVSILIRLFLVILASLFGAYGILLGLLGLLAHVVSLRSFGVPCMAPVAPFSLRDFFQDILLRAPVWLMSGRPRTIGWHNPIRQEEGLMPAPAADDSKDDYSSGPENSS